MYIQTEQLTVTLHILTNQNSHDESLWVNWVKSPHVCLEKSIMAWKKVSKKSYVLGRSQRSPILGKKPRLVKCNKMTHVHVQYIISTNNSWGCRLSRKLNCKSWAWSKKNACNAQKTKWKVQDRGVQASCPDYLHPWRTLKKSNGQDETDDKSKEKHGNNPNKDPK